MNGKYKKKKCKGILFTLIFLIFLLSYWQIPNQPSDLCTNNNNILPINSKEKSKPFKSPIAILDGVEDFRERREEVKERILAELSKTFLVISSIDYFLLPCLDGIYASVIFHLREWKITFIWKINIIMADNNQ